MGLNRLPNYGGPDPGPKTLLKPLVFVDGVCDVFATLGRAPRGIFITAQNTNIRGIAWDNPDGDYVPMTLNRGFYDLAYRIISDQGTTEANVFLAG